MLTIKLSLPLLLAVLGVLVTRPRALTNWACLAAGALLLFSLGCRVQLGIRMMLPLVVLGVVGLAAALVRLGQDQGPGRRRVGALGMALAIAWTACATLRVWPDGLCYVNEAWGGTAQGYRLVSESNYDGGQGLKELDQWCAANAVSELDVWYFGTDPAYPKMPLRDIAWQALPVSGPEAVVAREQGHCLAVSTTLLYGNPITEAHRRAAAFLRTCPPMARTATFLIYDFRARGPKLAAAELRRIAR